MGIIDLLGPFARLGVTWLSRSRLPQIDGDLTLPGLKGRVEVIRDRWGIPHIFADNSHDLFFVQGFVHAQDRLWQMELNRRTAQGRLSEIFGELALDTDRATRTLGFNRLGSGDWEKATDETRETIHAYCAGVNAFMSLADGKLPVEFTLLGLKPGPWQPEDSFAFMRMVIWQLSHAWYSEITRARIAQAVGAERAAELEILYPERNPLALPEGIEFNRLDLDGRLQKADGPFLQRGKGSNAWAVCGQKSATGHAFLCNDMHLPLSLPSIWYEAHLVGGDYQVTGVTMPGVPSVLVGHNARIAWGMTLAFTDCEDLFVEKFDPRSPQRYLYQGEWLEAEVVEETIAVKGRQQPHQEQVRITRHGPVISEVVGYTEQQVAISSMALRPCQAFSGWLLLNRAGSWDQFVEAMRLIEAPQLNVTYGDVDNNIGYWVAGKVPVRARGDGSVPAPGWTGEHEWVGEVPFEEMPHALNPERGYLINCNHRIVPAHYPHFLGNAWMNGYRARRVEQCLVNKDRLCVEDFRAIQMDFACLPGQEFVALLEGLNTLDPDIQLALAQLRGWDGRLTSDSTGGAVYEVVRYALVRNLFEPGLGRDLSLQFMGKGFHVILLKAHEFYGHDTVVMLRLLKNPDSWWVRQAGGREAVLQRSLKQAVEWLRAQMGPEVEDWQWGRLHQLTFSHPLAVQKPLDGVFNRGPFPIGGDADTPFQTGMDPAEPYAIKVSAPSFRQIVDLGDLSRSIAMFPPGQSGQVGSPHYDDLIEPWLNGEYHPMLWTREQVEREAEGRLSLKGVRSS